MSDDTEKGRKYGLTLYTINIGALLALVGIGASAYAPPIATSIADILGSFALILSIANGSFNAANAAISWKLGLPQTTVQQSSTTTVTGDPRGVAMPPIPVSVVPAEEPLPVSIQPEDG